MVEQLNKEMTTSMSDRDAEVEAEIRDGEMRVIILFRKELV